MFVNIFRIGISKSVKCSTTVSVFLAQLRISNIALYLFFLIRLLMRNLASESDALPPISEKKKFRAGWLVVIAFDWVVLKIPTDVVSV